ncbi:hypothetical protein CKA32_000618 [Geitlerinema sp. FC II]|nr:hypothetical protein CKA32_000618 [Geitlerinema sp. FC II]
MGLYGVCSRSDRRDRDVALTARTAKKTRSQYVLNVFFSFHFMQF